MGTGCGWFFGLGDDEGDCHETQWQLLPRGLVRVEPWQTRVEYRVGLIVTEEGAAADDGGETWSRARMDWFAAPPSDERSLRIGDIGLDRADGTYGATSMYGREWVTLVSVLGDCGSAPCTREFRAWADVIDNAPDGADLIVGLDFTAGFADVGCTPGSPLWLLSDVDRVGDVEPDETDASVPPDGG